MKTSLTCWLHVLASLNAQGVYQVRLQFIDIIIRSGSYAQMGRMCEGTVLPVARAGCRTFALCGLRAPTWSVWSMCMWTMWPMWCMWPMCPKPALCPCELGRNRPIRIPIPIHVPMWTNRIGQSNSYPIQYQSNPITNPIPMPMQSQCTRYKVHGTRYTHTCMRVAHDHHDHCNSNQWPIDQLTMWPHAGTREACDHGCMVTEPIVAEAWGHEKGHTLRVCPCVWCGVNAIR